MLLDAAAPRVSYEQQTRRPSLGECRERNRNLISRRCQCEPLSFFAQRTNSASVNGLVAWTSAGSNGAGGKALA